MNRGYGGALRSGFASRVEGRHLLHRRRRAVRPVRDGAALAEDGARRRSRERLQDQPLGSVASHRHRPDLPPHREADVRAARARRRLRFPPAAPVDFRARAAGEEQRRHLPGDDEEDPGRRVHDRRGPGSPLPSRARPVAVLQLPPRDPHGHRRAEALVRARRAADASTAAGRAPWSDVARRAPGNECCDAVISGVLSRPPRDDYRRPRLHRQQHCPAARRARLRRAADGLAHSRFGRELLQHRRHRRQSPRQHRRRAPGKHDEPPGSRSRGHLQPRRPGQPHRQHEGSAHRSRDQLPQPAVDSRSVPEVQPGA